MATVKIVTHTRKNKDGSHPLTLRITKNRKSSYIFFDKRIYEKDWDALTQSAKRTHPNHKRLNAYLHQIRTDAENLILDFERNGKDFSFDLLKKHLKLDKKSDSFFAYANTYFGALEEAQDYNRLTAERPAINHFKRFLKDKDIAFIDITVALLKRFKIYLSKITKPTKKKEKKTLSPRTIVNYLIILRGIYKQAIKDGIARQEHYPFGVNKFRIKKPESLKIGLNEAEVKILETLDLSEKPYEHHVRNLWLYSFYFAGMRVSDVLQSRWSSFKDDRLYYIMSKNGKEGSLKIPPKALVILEQYRDQKRDENDLVFPDLKMIEDFSDKIRVQKRIKEVIRRANLTLKDIAKKANIDKHLTMHIARHTFGNLSGDKIPVQILQKLYRHSSISTTINYQRNFLHKETDEALDTVLDF